MTVVEFSVFSSVLLKYPTEFQADRRSFTFSEIAYKRTVLRRQFHASVDGKHLLPFASAIEALAFVSRISSAISVLCKLNDKFTRQVNQFENELGSLLCHEKNCTVMTFFRSGK